MAAKTMKELLLSHLPAKTMKEFLSDQLLVNVEELETKYNAYQDFFYEVNMAMEIGKFENFRDDVKVLVREYCAKVYKNGYIVTKGGD